MFVQRQAQEVELVYMRNRDNTQPMPQFTYSEHPSNPV